MTLPRALFALTFLLTLPASGGAEPRTAEPAPPAEADTLVGPGASVPFVGQGDLLCGGASAAMIERHWGRTGVYADDYAGLVRPAEGGIRTSELVGRMAHRGFEVRALPPEPEALVRALAAGVPPMVLLGPSADVLHYVVVVAADRQGVRIHDPEIGPFRTLAWDDFLVRWSDSGRWAVTATPTESAAPDSPRTSAGLGEGAPRTPARLEEAMRLLRAGEHRAARQAARSLVEEGLEAPAASETARRLIATSYYREGLEREALGAWNEVGEPRVDLVSVHGARLTRHSVLAERTGIEQGRMLEGSQLDLADRRLSDLPAVSASRTAYRPLPNGAVSVDAYVTEHPRWPGRYDLVPELARAVTDHEARMGFGPFLGAGDRWSVAAGWRDARPFWTASVASVAPPLPGVVTLAVDWRRERYASSADPDVPPETSEQRLRTSLSLREWVVPAVRLAATVGLERWRDDRRLGSVGVSALASLADGDVRIETEVEGWRGSDRGFSRFSGRLGLTHAWGGGASLDWVLGATATSAHAPRLVWPGAGTGEVRRPLLRAHPLDDGAAIGGPGFGPHLVHSTLELRGSRRIFGPMRLGAALFADGARVWPEDGADAHHLVDVGAGLFIDSGGETMRLDLARGDAGWVLSARVSHRSAER